MKPALAFDVYGTLINVNALENKLKNLLNDLSCERVREFSRIWRNKQLEYSFRRALMDKYVDFSVCTYEALEYTCLYFKVSLNSIKKNKLLDSYQTLPAFEDVEAGLKSLQEKFSMFAFSNGTSKAVEIILKSAGIRKYFLGVVSVENIKTFKPNHLVYQYFLKKTQSNINKTWLISSNPFDVIGAMSAGMKTVWVKRSIDEIFDPWNMEPEIPIITVSSIIDIEKMNLEK